MNRFTIKCVIACGFAFCSLCVFADNNDWAWSYKKYFNNYEISKNVKNEKILFGKNKVEPFSQLICSFNAFRPGSGHFSFYVKTRNARNKKWGKWHKMIDWGKNIQKSYFSKDDDSKYVYVRLETGLQNLADAFCVKVESHDRADLHLVKGVCVCVSDFNKFRNEYIGKQIASLKSVRIKNVPKISQRILDHPRTNCLCSPTSCSILASYFNGNKINAAMFANTVFDYGLQVYGSWPFNMAALYNVCRGKVYFYTTRMNSFKDLHKKLIEKSPVAVSVRGRIKGAPKSYNSGHLMVVIGWDAKNKKVICHDPAFYSDRATLARYDLESFLRAWERSNRLAYVAEPRFNT